MAPDGEEAGAGDFCVDLAYVLGDVYCHATVHVPGQTKETYLWWTDMYCSVLSGSAVNMPHTLSTGLGARCYAALQALIASHKEDREVQYAIVGKFSEAWIGLRVAHTHLFGHTAYTALICVAYPEIRNAVVEFHDLIADAERDFQMRMALAQGSGKPVTTAEEGTQAK